MKLNKSGFTIVEVLLVVVVITILTTIGVMSYRQSQNKAEAAAVKATADIVITGLERYYKDNGEYPTPRQLASGPTAVAPNATTGHNPIATSGITESNFIETAKLLRASTNSLFNDRVRLVPCINGTEVTACTPDATKITWVYYFARSNQTTTGDYNRTLSGCTVRMANTSETGVTSYALVYYDKATSTWIFKKSINGTVTISGTGCSFTT